MVKKFLDEPEGDDPSPKHNGPQSNAAKMLDIDVSAPLRKDEMLQETKEYKMQTREDVEREDRRKARQAKKEEKEAKKKARADKKLADLGEHDMLFDDSTTTGSSKKSSSKREKKEKKEKKSSRKDSKESKSDAIDMHADLLGSSDDLLMGGNTTASGPVMGSSGGMSDLLDSMDLGDSTQSTPAPAESSLMEDEAKVKKKKKKEKDSSAESNVCSRITSSGADKNAYEEALTGSGCGCLASCKIKISKDKIQQAIEQIAAHLKVEMVDCVPGAVSFFGVVDGTHPIGVLIKARSSGVSVEVRSFNDEFVAAVLEEAKICASKL